LPASVWFSGFEKSKNHQKQLQPPLCWRGHAGLDRAEESGGLQTRESESCILSQLSHKKPTNIQLFFFERFWALLEKCSKNIRPKIGKKRKKKKKKGPKLEEAKSSGKFKPKTFSYQIAPKKSTKITKAKR
jgi:hypothetical protein